LIKPEYLDVRVIDDIDKETVTKLVLAKPGYTKAHAEEIFNLVGGRLMDVNSIINGNALHWEIRFLPVLSNALERYFIGETEGHKWTKEQFLATMKFINNASDNVVPYTSILEEVFNGDDQPLQALIEADILTMLPNKETKTKEDQIEPSTKILDVKQTGRVVKVSRPLLLTIWRHTYDIRTAQIVNGL